MKCPKCFDDMVLTRATNFGSEYHYCRICKKELSELEDAPLKAKYDPFLHKHINTSADVPSQFAGGFASWATPAYPVSTGSVVLNLWSTTSIPCTTSDHYHFNAKAHVPASRPGVLSLLCSCGEYEKDEYDGSVSKIKP